MVINTKEINHSIFQKKKAKKGLVDILKYNKKILDEQKIFKIKNDKKVDEDIKGKILNENEIKIEKSN